MSGDTSGLASRAKDDPYANRDFSVDIKHPDTDDGITDISDSDPEENLGHFSTSRSHGRDLEVLERDKAGIIQRRWLHAQGQPPIEIDAPKLALLSTILSYPSTLTTAFLPVGFPHSVSTDYLAYQTYDSLQAFFSTITSLLASRALLQGLGVGDADSSATFALLLTILNDATSRIATILFAQRFGLRIEPDAKRYRFLADLFNDTAFFLDLASPYLGSYGKILTLCAARGLGALCGVAAGASKAALSVHFAKHDNLAELNAKEASQETAVGLIGLLVGSVVVRFVEEPRTVVALMIVLVLLHLCVNYLGVCAVSMTSLNRQRCTILTQEYITTGEILTPAEVAARESIVFWSPVIRNKDGRSWHIEVATDYSRACTGTTEVIQRPGYDLFVRNSPDTTKPSIRILLHAEVDTNPRVAIAAWSLAVRVASQDGQLAKGYFPEGGWERLEKGGWNLATQAIETCAPVRFETVAADKKKQ